jgi:hypothetical protein
MPYYPGIAFLYMPPLRINSLCQSSHRSRQISLQIRAASLKFVKPTVHCPVLFN